MNAGNGCSAHLSSGREAFQYWKVYDQYQEQVLSGNVFKTSSGAEFRCKYADIKEIERLLCSQCSKHKQHIMEGRPLGHREIIDKAILDMRPKDVSMIEPLIGHTLAADINCIKEADPSGFGNYGEDEELTGLSQRLTVHCARKLPADQGGVQVECLQSVTLSELPEHFHDTNCHRSLVPPVVEPQRLHPASEGLGSHGNFSGRLAGSEDERSLVHAFQRQLMLSNERNESLQEINKVQAWKISELQRTVDSLSNTVYTLSLTCAYHESQINALKDQRTDGTYVWVIDDFREAIEAARTGRKTSLRSPAFYSAPDGYRMSVKIYPNGDGEGKGTHISLFLAIMKGKYDDILTWPFNKNLTFEIIGKGGQVVWADGFDSQLTSSSFEKPQGDMNIPSGCPLFMAIKDLKPHMLPGGSLYVKTKVGEKAFPFNG